MLLNLFHCWYHLQVNKVTPVSYKVSYKVPACRNLQNRNKVGVPAAFHFSCLPKLKQLLRQHNLTWFTIFSALLVLFEFNDLAKWRKFTLGETRTSMSCWGSRLFGNFFLIRARAESLLSPKYAVATSAPNASAATMKMFLNWLAQNVPRFLCRMFRFETSFLSHFTVYVWDSFFESLHV